MGRDSSYSGSETGWDFVVDATLLGEAKKKCTDVADEIAGYIEDIYTQIADLESDWSGDSYLEFSSSCDKYRDSLNQLVNLIDAYAELINKVDSARIDLEEEIKSAVGS